VGLVAFLMGIPSALSMAVFNNQDWVWGVGLLISGLLVAVAALCYGVDRFRRECINDSGTDFKVGPWLNVVLAVVIPLEFAAMLSWWFYQSITSYDPAGWWQPFHVFSVGTCLAQWGMVLALLFLFNSRLARWSTR